jgi:hypothetical protein
MHNSLPSLFLHQLGTCQQKPTSPQMDSVKEQLPTLIRKAVAIISPAVWTWKQRSPIQGEALPGRVRWTALDAEGGRSPRYQAGVLSVAEAKASGSCQ